MSVSWLRSALSVVGILLLEVLRHVHFASVLGFAASSDLHDVAVALSDLELAGTFVWLASLDGAGALAKLERVGVASPALEPSCGSGVGGVVVVGWVGVVVVAVVSASSGGVGGEIGNSSGDLLRGDFVGD